MVYADFYVICKLTEYWKIYCTHWRFYRFLEGDEIIMQYNKKTVSQVFFRVRNTVHTKLYTYMIYISTTTMYHVPKLSRWVRK